MKKQVWTFILLLITLIYVKDLHAQNPGRGKSDFVIKGKILAKEFNQPLEYATIAAFRVKDTFMSGGAVSGEEGKFSINVKPGRYFLEIRHLSFESKTIRDITVNSKQNVHNVGNIALGTGSQTMDEVEVQAERGAMQLKLDKRVVNVSEDLTNQGNNVSEILDNVPSVEVDVEGNVSLRGSENVRILINGKPSGLTGISSVDALRQLHGDMVDRIEVITNPSARYDAEGEAGIINIILKKDKKGGFNGSISANAGYPDNLGAGLNLNYKKDWFNLFSGYSFRYRNSPGQGSTYMEYDDGDTSYTYTSDREHQRKDLGHTFRLGSEFYLDSSNTLTVSGLYRYGDGENNTTLIYRDFNETGEITQKTIRSQVEEEIDGTMEFNMNYQKDFSRKDQKLTMAAQWFKAEDTEKADITEENTLGGDELIKQGILNEEDEENRLFQADYVHPFKGEGKFETGVKVTSRIINNDYEVRQLDENGLWYTLPQYDDHFQFEEDIYAAYAIISHMIGEFSLQAGLRSEYSNIRTEIRDENVENQRSYLDFFPSIHTSYELDKENTFQLSYSRRLSRPRFRSLLPFSNFSDSRNLYSGNPNLNPEYTNSFEAGYLRYFEKGSLLSTVYYRHRTGVIDRITIVRPDDINRRMPVNLAEENAIGLEFSGNYNLFKWWSLNGSFNLYNSDIHGSYEGRNYESNTMTWSSRFSTKVSPGDAFDLQASIRYRGPREITQGYREPTYSVDLGLAKDIFNDKGKISFNVRDLLNSRVWRSTIDEKNYYQENEFQWRERQFMLNFTYYLNQKPKKERGNRGGHNGKDEGF